MNNITVHINIITLILYKLNIPNIKGITSTCSIEGGYWSLDISKSFIWEESKQRHIWYGSYRHSRKWQSEWQNDNIEDFVGSSYCWSVEVSFKY